MCYKNSLKDKHEDGIHPPLSLSLTKFENLPKQVQSEKEGNVWKDETIENRLLITGVQP
jgi:hypothetical protein